MRRRRRGKKREKERDGKRQTVEQSLRKREGDREVGGGGFEQSGSGEKECE
jgi:hypothetical protein